MPRSSRRTRQVARASLAVLALLSLPLLIGFLTGRPDDDEVVEGSVLRPSGLEIAVGAGALVLTVALVVGLCYVVIRVAELLGDAKARRDAHRRDVS